MILKLFFLYMVSVLSFSYYIIFEYFMIFVIKYDLVLFSIVFMYISVVFIIQNVLENQFIYNKKCFRVFFIFIEDIELQLI